MSDASRERLATIVSRDDCDLAEAALLVCQEVEPDLDVDAELLRLDAYADVVRTMTAGDDAPLEPLIDGQSEDDLRAASRLASFLGHRLGFRGDVEDYHDPANGLLTRVLDRRRGLPITLAIIYVSVARRAGIPAFGVNTPGHFLVGIRSARASAPVILDPFDAGRVLDRAGIGDRIHDATAGLADISGGHLGPAKPATVLRRLLNNLTRDFLAAGDAEDALWTLELKLLLPGRDVASDARGAGELLVRLGRYRDAAELLETYIPEAGHDADELAVLAMRARAKLN